MAKQTMNHRNFERSVGKVHSDAGLGEVPRGDDRNTYMNADFYDNPTNRWWETAMYSEETKEKLRKMKGVRS